MKTYLSLLLMLSASCSILAQKLRPDCEQKCAEGGAAVVTCDDGKFTFLPCNEGETCSEESQACGTCGDGAISPGEVCDDGNQKDGDGCSARCQEEDASNCGNREVEAGEACDDGNNINGDACETNCTLPTCGNGILDSGEECEDGNTINNDNCSSLCKNEVCGDGTLQTGEQCDDGNIIENDGCSSVCAIVAAVGCGNGQLETNLGEVCDDNNVLNGDGCRSDCRGKEICGDGLLDVFEQCDEATTNSSTRPNACRGDCQNPTCGDAVVDDPEDCDDGNTVNNDACSNTCALIVIAENDTNQTAVEADAVANGDARFDVKATTRFSGSIDPLSNDFDTFRITLPAPTTVRMETFDTSGQDCLTIDTTLVLGDQQDNTLLFDDGGGINFCSALVTLLPAGSSYIAVSDFNGNGVGSYILEINLLANLGSEQEPNDSIAQAVPLSGKNIVVLGNHQVRADADFYKIEIVENNLSIRIEAVEGGNETCQSAEIDPNITLLDGGGAEIISDDDDGRVLCALIDGTGAASKDPAAHNLPPGTYFIRVDTVTGASLDGGLFDYRLAITIR